MAKKSNRDIILFFLKSGGIYALWYVLYELWILPDGSVDEWLSLDIVGKTASILSILNFQVFIQERIVGIVGNGGIEIVNGCNGIAAMGLFIGFVVAYPGKWINRMLFIVFGIFVIYLVNIGRIVTLVVIQEYWPQFFHITHDYSTTAIFYMVIFGLWIVWSNYGEKFDRLLSDKFSHAV